MRRFHASRHSWATLSEEAMMRLRKMLAEQGVMRTSRGLHTSIYTIETLQSGGTAMRVTVERIEAALREVA